MSDLHLPAAATREIERIPPRHREDATQEAWVAFLEARRDGRDAAAAARLAVKRYAQAELRHERRVILAGVVGLKDDD